VRCSPLAASWLVSGLQFEIAHFPGMQRRAGPQIAFALAQQMPDQDGELAGMSMRSRLAQWPRHTSRCPRRLDQHAAGMSTPLFGNSPIARTQLGIAK
jgi:hypothetical protein